VAGKIVLFGATGYTGELTAEALVRGGEKPLLAGRNPRKLDALNHRLGGKLEMAVADVEKEDSIFRLLGRGDVLISCAGPFTKVGDAAVRAAIAAGADYLDSAGEAAFTRRVFDVFGPTAEKAEVGLLTSFGNDWVSGNLAGALALQEAGDAAKRVDIGYFATGGGAGGGFSAGTRAATITQMPDPAFAWRGGHIVQQRAGRKVRRFEVDGRKHSALSVGGTEHYTLPRLAPQLEDVNVYLGWFGRMTRALQVSGAAMSAAFAIPGAKRAYRAVTSPLARGSAGGPSADARAAARSIWIAEAFDGDGKSLAEVRLTGPDAYTLTAELLAWGAAKTRDGKLKRIGALGPVDGFGLEELWKGCEAIGVKRAA
jgi:short subunit dehydrogenase-like uncharacterized protein